MADRDASARPVRRTRNRVVLAVVVVRRRALGQRPGLRCCFGHLHALGLDAVFGIDGTIVRTSDGWTAGGGTDATLTVRDDAMLSWAFADAAAQDAAQGGVFVSTARARAVTTALLASIGVDPDSVDWRVDRFDTSLAITATELLNDERTSLEWQVSFGQKDAVVSASGFAAELIEVPNYSAGSSDEASLRVDVSSIVITDAELDLAEFHQPDGAVLILPAYHLTGDDGTRWTLIAVTGDYVNFVDMPFPGRASQTP